MGLFGRVTVLPFMRYTIFDGYANSTSSLSGRFLESFIGNGLLAGPGTRLSFGFTQVRKSGTFVVVAGGGRLGSRIFAGGDLDGMAAGGTFPDAEDADFDVGCAFFGISWTIEC